MFVFLCTDAADEGGYAIPNSESNPIPIAQSVPIDIPSFGLRSNRAKRRKPRDATQVCDGGAGWAKLLTHAAKVKLFPTTINCKNSHHGSPPPHYVIY